jgi:hypothetical protein
MTPGSQACDAIGQLAAREQRLLREERGWRKREKREGEREKKE